MRTTHCPPRYYALLHNNRSTYTSGVLTLFSIWSKLCFSNREIEVARKQFEWWLQELEKSTPDHPVTLALHTNHAVPFAQSLAMLKQVLQGYGALLIEGSPSRQEPAAAFHYKTGAMAASAIALPSSDARATVENVGVALSKFRCIRHVHRHTANGLLCLPFELMSDAGLSPASLVRGQYSPELNQFLQQQLSEINKQFEEYFDSARDQPQHRFLYVYTKLQQRLLVAYQQNIQLLDNSDYRLTPLQNFWHAWRAKRQLSRQ
ncbi:MAG: squalene/phytoene synthase family protein [Pseudomonadota bacterium]